MKLIQGEYNVKSRRIIFSFVVALIALLITVLLQWDYFTGVVFPKNSEETFNILMNVPESMNINKEDFDDFIQLRRYVPNYDTEIFIQLDNSKFELGDNITLRISIFDEGIVPLKKPYFYFFIVNPSGGVVVSFPDTIHQVSSYSKMTPWSTLDHHNDFYRDCLSYQILFIPRTTLIDGYGKFVYTYQNHLYWSEDSEIAFQYSIAEDSTLIGIWKVYLFTFDEEYVDRLGNILQAPEANNFIDSSIAEFQVTARSPPENIDYPELFKKYLISPTVFVITFTLNYIGIYPSLEKRKEKLERIWQKIRENWVFTSAIVLIVIIQIIFFFI